jgi:iron complex outermembrane recepter protein
MRYDVSLRRVMLSGSVLALAAAMMPTAASAQTAEEDTTEQGLVTGEPQGENRDILVTGSRIRRDPNDSSLPLQIVSIEEISREGISSPEQLISYLSTNGNAGDNLASNADVVSGQQRGNNGASFANLRGQGSAGTLVLLNGRRMAAHGLNGGAVDVNQIPFAAIERVEVLKDGASAIYGTDAIGGVINFITRTDFTGVNLNGFVDITERGDSPIYRLSGIVGYGDLDDQGFNVMASVSYSRARALRGSQRDFVNTFQPNRGLSVDTRGTPFATFIPLAGTAYQNATAPLIPGRTDGLRYTGGINILDLPGQAGCGSIDGQAPYDPVIWAFPQAAFACAWDTGRAAVLQQPLETLTWFGRAVARFGEHELSLEVTGSDATAEKRFSNLQLTPNTSTQNYAYRRIAGVNDAIFDNLATRLTAAFPTFGPLLTATPALSYRWRCIECGPREITTDTMTQRYALGLEGPISDAWDYRLGASYATSESESTLGSGYFFRGTTDEVRGVVNGVNNVLITPSALDPRAPTAPGATAPGLIGVLNSGILNPFLFPGQTQSEQALAMLRAVSAEGTVLYGGKFEVTQIDGSVSGSLFELPGGTAQIAVGFDYRREQYRFNGDARSVATRAVIIAAPFDDGNQLAGTDREIRAAYAELLLPVFDGFELTAAVRIDDYSDFGSTTNPKFSFQYRPVEWLMLRGSYNTGFRAPSFAQVSNPPTPSPYTGRDIAEPTRCPGGVPTTAIVGCAALTNLSVINGGNVDLRPETSEQASAGIVFEPSRSFSASIDWWMINRDDAIQTLSLRQLIDNITLFPDRFIRDSAGNLLSIDQRWQNTGSTRTQGLEVAFTGRVDLGGGQLSAGLQGTYLIEKDERVSSLAAFSNRIGVFSFAGDLGLEWKHNAFITWSNDNWSISLSLPGIANGSINPPDDVIEVDDYTIYNLSLGYNINEAFRLTFGVRNLFDTDPPFAVTYDSNTGAGSSWEPRVADPRGRSYTMSVSATF